MREGEGAGWSVLTRELHRREADAAARSVVVDVDAQGRPRLNEGHRQVRLGVGISTVCSGRQGVARLGRNRGGSSSETEVLGEELWRPGGVARWGD